MSYQQLSADERFQIYELNQIHQQGPNAIARALGRSASTISRELRRNRDDTCGNYRPDIAQQQAVARRQQSQAQPRPLREEIVSAIKTGLEQYHSPEQIAGRLQREGQGRCSHETIYQMIATNRYGFGKYQAHLRWGRVKRQRRGAAKGKRGGIVGRVGIEQRPAIADAKTEMGHWESDTMIGQNHTGVIVTHVDKASKFLLAGLAKDKSAEAVKAVTLRLFRDIPAAQRQTMTSDNGKEFSNHQAVADALELSYYFANPYHSWERGLNEHTNGLIRQFFPKGTNFKIVKPEALERVVDLINHRPRKSLDYRTPYEVFYEHRSDTVALQI